MQKVRIGLIGCGMVAQVMHLPYLRELDDRFELAALCDVSPGSSASSTGITRSRGPTPTVALCSIRPTSTR
jgi:predicted dehydrogenase